MVDPGQEPLLYAIGIMAVGFVLFRLFPDVFLSLFEADGEDAGDLLAIGVPALRIISFHFLFAGVCVVSMSVFQALGHGVLSLVVAIVRQLVILLPGAFLLSRLGGLSAVWWAFPLAESFAVALCGGWQRRKPLTGGFFYSELFRAMESPVSRGRCHIQIPPDVVLFSYIPPGPPSSGGGGP